MIGQNYAYGYPTWQEAMEVWHDEVNDYKYGLEDQDFYYSVLITHYTQVRNLNLMNIFYISLFVNSQTFSEEKTVCSTHKHPMR